MENEKYKSPEIEILNMETEHTILIASIVGEEINDWEDM